MSNSEQKNINITSKNMSPNNNAEQDSNRFFLALKFCLKSNDIEKLRHLLTSSDYPSLSKTAKDKTVFNLVVFNPTHAMIDFLIFDYKMERNELTDLYCKNTDWLEKKFAARDMATSIEQELPVNVTNTKKLKV